MCENCNEQYGILSNDSEIVSPDGAGKFLGEPIKRREKGFSGIGMLPDSTSVPKQKRSKKKKGN